MSCTECKGTGMVLVEQDTQLYDPYRRTEYMTVKCNKCKEKADELQNENSRN